MRLRIAHDWQFAEGSLITVVRNKLTADFIHSDATHMMWIDADIVFRPEDVLKLLALQTDIAVATYRAKRPNAPYTAWKDGAPIKDLNQFKEPVEVDGAGCGFMLIKRNVIDRLASEAVVYPAGGQFEFALYQSVAAKGWFCSEDVFFCQNARAAGFKIIMEPSIRLGHIGQCVYGGSIPA